MPSLDQNLAIQEEKLRTAGCQMIRIRCNVSGLTLTHIFFDG
jgi:hypothetical protein